MVDPDPEFAANLQAEVPHAARIWNHWMGGSDNFPADRAAGDAVAAVYPEIVLMARQSRRFLVRAVRFLAAEAGIRQFLDVGSGLPTMHNTHEVAQEVAARSRVVYVDHDPMVLAHAHALLANSTTEGSTTYLHADYHDPEKILADAAGTLDFREPVAVMFMGVLGYESDLRVVRAIVQRTMQGTASGSHLVFWDGTDTSPSVVAGADRLVRNGGVPYILRAPDQLAGCFEGLMMVEPGLVPITRWRPDDPGAEGIDAYGAVARKP